MDPDRLVAIAASGSSPATWSGARVLPAGVAPPTALRKARARGRAPSGCPRRGRAAQRAAQGIPEALWALARIGTSRRPAGRRARQPRSVSLRAVSDDPGVADARAARRCLLQRSTEEARARGAGKVATAGAGAALLAGLAAWLWAA